MEKKIFLTEGFHIYNYPTVTIVFGSRALIKNVYRGGSSIGQSLGRRVTIFPKTNWYIFTRTVYLIRQSDEMTKTGNKRTRLNDVAVEFDATLLQQRGGHW